VSQQNEYAEHYVVLGLEIALCRREGTGQDIVNRLQAERNEMARILRRSGWTLEPGS